MRIWRIEKEESSGGSTFCLGVGIPGHPDFVSVNGLTRKQGEHLGIALIAVENSARSRTLKSIRDALEIKEK